MSDNSDMSLNRFNDEYKDKPAWDIGKPQQTLFELFAIQAPVSPVVEMGCGMGDLSIYMASLGADVLGVDFAEQSIVKSRQQAAQSPQAQLEFKQLDIFSLASLGKTFNTAVDCCFFHMFDDDARLRYEGLLRQLIRPGGKLHMLNFAMQLPTPNAPRAVTADDIETTFSQGWRVRECKAATIEVTFSPSGIPGTYACIERMT